MTTEEQTAYQAELENNASECAAELADKITNARTGETMIAARAALKMAYIMGAQWAMIDAIAIVQGK